MSAPPPLNRLNANDFPPEFRPLIEALNPGLQSTAGGLGGQLTYENMAVDVKVVRVQVPDPVVAPTLAGSWANVGGDYTDAGYYRQGSRVYLRGLIAGGTYSTTPIFTLPAGFRPDAEYTFAPSQSSVADMAGRIAVNPDGQVIAPVITSVQSGTSTFLSLDEVSFPVGDGVPYTPLSIAVASTLPRVKSVEVQAAYDVTNRSPVPVAYPAIAWEPSTSGIVLRDLQGLVPIRTYELRLVLKAY